MKKNVEFRGIIIMYMNYYSYVVNFNNIIFSMTIIDIDILTLLITSKKIVKLMKDGK